MKNLTIISAISAFSLAVFGGSLLAQTGQTAVAGSNPAPTQDIPPPTAFQVVKNDSNSRIWQRLVYEKAPDGHIVSHPHSYTELQAGVNYWNNGQLTPSKEEIDLQPDGSAAATQCQNPVSFPPDICQGTIRMTLPSGETLQSQPSALAYDDGQNTVILAVLTNSVGQLVGKNQVIYTNAFAGAGWTLTYYIRTNSLAQSKI